MVPIVRAAQRVQRRVQLLRPRLKTAASAVCKGCLQLQRPTILRVALGPDVLRVPRPSFGCCRTFRSRGLTRHRVSSREVAAQLGACRSAAAPAGAQGTGQRELMAFKPNRNEMDTLPPLGRHASHSRKHCHLVAIRKAWTKHCDPPVAAPRTHPARNNNAHRLHQPNAPPTHTHTPRPRPPPPTSAQVAHSHPA